MQEEIYRPPLFIPMTTLTHEKAIHRKDIFELSKNISLRPYFEEKKQKIIIYKEDCFDILLKIPEGSIDMIFVDPPYFLSNGGITCHAGRMVSVNKGKWDISKGIEENFIFTQRWLRECQRVLTPNGTI